MSKQEFDKDVSRVISAAEMIAGNHAKAVAWLDQAIAAFDGKTPLQLIAEGHIDIVIGYLRSIESGFSG